MRGGRGASQCQIRVVGRAPLTIPARVNVVNALTTGHLSVHRRKPMTRKGLWMMVNEVNETHTPVQKTAALIVLAMDWPKSWIASPLPKVVHRVHHRLVESTHVAAPRAT